MLSVGALYEPRQHMPALEAQALNAEVLCRYMYFPSDPTLPLRCVCVSLQPRPNVIIRLCSIECNFAMPLTDPSNAPFQKDMGKWAAVSNRTYIWNCDSRPLPNPCKSESVLPGLQTSRAKDARSLDVLVCAQMSQTSALTSCLSPIGNLLRRNISRSCHLSDHPQTHSI